MAATRSKRREAVRIRSFPAVSRSDAGILILGSMPGVASLAAGQYYAHPRNAFWPIMSRLLGFDAAAPYAARLDALVSSRIALWDVLDSCERTGSLDASIQRENEAVNDFAAFFRAHPRIRRVLLNGTKAHDTFRRNVAADVLGDAITIARLPSTSPANASWSFERKLEAWRRALDDARR